ncbi:MAG: phosphoenolpyruvate carboxykinase (ATP) [Bacteroidota bacterium]|nr:phosphoenolpyruvate carboxykinase (ATP) [Bacteroidota bacterium]
MNEFGKKSHKTGLDAIGIKKCKNVYWNLLRAELLEHIILNKEGVLTSTGAVMVDTGKFTGRSPEDKFWVKDATTENVLWWGNVNHPISTEIYEKLLGKMTAFVQDKNLYVRDMYACADPEYQISLRVISTTAYHNLFSYNMFIRPEFEDMTEITPEYTVLCVPEFEADPAVDGTRSSNFAILNLTTKTVIIGGTGYTGEIKKGIFSILNYLLPEKHNSLSMHCSANVGEHGDTAVFFGLSGTGKTTLSADPNRRLIGDDEHGWGEHGIFNFEGGCYAKVINLSKEQEPEIWEAIKFGAILENTRFFPERRLVDYSNTSVTQNTRVSYPIYHVDNIMVPSIGGIPKNIFFLTCDAFGVLPPISKLTPGQAMFHFISGYTAKVAGTEMGVKDPTMTFSACFGAPFLPLHPTRYASLLGEQMRKLNVNVWLVNTGWSGGGFGVGSRMKLSLTRAMITSAMEHKLDNVVYQTMPYFGLLIPGSCPNVPFEILNPRATWKDKAAYDEKAKFLATAFLKNFETFKDYATPEILEGAPKV